MIVNLFYLSENNYGGWKTYTHHLARSLLSQNIEFRIFKMGRTELSVRDFGCGMFYQNVDKDVAREILKSGPCLFTALSKDYVEYLDLLDDGFHITVHDPTELKHIDFKLLQGRRVLVIRKKMQELLSTLGIDSTFIRHPYLRNNEHHYAWYRRKKRAVSLSRIDFDKNILLIGQANELLPPESKIRMYGFDGRIYSHFKLDKDCPSWRDNYGGKFPHVWGMSVMIACEYRFLVDMSTIKGDGDGTQYTFLEGWDAGCLPVLHKEWLTTPDEVLIPGETCFTVNTPEELAAIVSTEEDYSDLAFGGAAVLEYHAPEVIIPQYLEMFGRA